MKCRVKASQTTPVRRGKILWVFATSRLDLKRQSRLDVHIPLSPPQDAAARRELFLAMAKKLKLPLKVEDLPPAVAEMEISGTEMEGLLVKAGRLHAIESARRGSARPLPQIIAEVFSDFRPSAHQDRLEYMDLLAVKECTDARFLPPRYRNLSLDEVNDRLQRLVVQMSV